MALSASLRVPPAEPVSVRIRNLGLGGACIELRGDAAQTSPSLDLETPIVIQVTAPTLWDPLSLQGKIAWVRPAEPGVATRAGVRFEHRDASSLYALFQLLGAHAYDA